MAGPTAEITLRWKNGLVFEGGGAGRPPATVDSNASSCAPWRSR